jgi:cytochrome c biogenesis protein
MLPSVLQAVSQNIQTFRFANQDYQLEFGEFRGINVESLPKPPSTLSIDRLVGSVADQKNRKKTHNLGPSIELKVRNAQGQAAEMQHYMLPVVFEGERYSVVAFRQKLNQPFENLYLPLDGDDRIDGFMRFNAALQTEKLRDQIANRIAQRLAANNLPLQAQIGESAKNLLTLFAQGGFPLIESTLEKDRNLETEQRKVLATSLIDMLMGSLFDVMDVANLDAKLPLIERTEGNFSFLRNSLVASSTLHDYPVPFFLQLTGFEQRQSSGFQITKSPGAAWVYLGALCLIIGMALMFYLKEVRLWVLLEDQQTSIAYSFSRQDAQNTRLVDEAWYRWQSLINQSETKDVKQ